jgi:hypothetical protein
MSSFIFVKAGASATDAAADGGGNWAFQKARRAWPQRIAWATFLQLTSKAFQKRLKTVGNRLEK